MYLLNSFITITRKQRGHHYYEYAGERAVGGYVVEAVWYRVVVEQGGGPYALDER